MSDEPLPDPPSARWFRLAEEDLVAARVLLGTDATPRIACFLAQQAAEKALKAGLFAVGRSFPRIHGLTRLLASYPDQSRPQVVEDDLDVLDPWVIDGRYAADLPAVAATEAASIVAIAQRVVEAVRPLIDTNGSD